MKKGFINIDTAKLVKADWNYKKEDEEKTKKLVGNFKRNGQIENIIVRELETGFYEVINGNHRKDVFDILKIKKVHTYNFGNITHERAVRIAIETNETRFDSDQLKLSELITMLTTKFKIADLSNTMPYSEDDINNFLEVANFDFDKLGENGIDLNNPEKFDINISLMVTPETFKRWEELKDRLARITGYDNESKVFEFAVIEALNIPLESIN